MKLFKVILRKVKKNFQQALPEDSVLNECDRISSSGKTPHIPDGDQDKLSPLEVSAWEIKEERKKSNDLIGWVLTAKECQVFQGKCRSKQWKNRGVDTWLAQTGITGSFYQ